MFIVVVASCDLLTQTTELALEYDTVYTCMWNVVQCNARSVHENW